MTYMKYMRKTWEIIGYTLDGGIYCADCAAGGDAGIYGNPVFEIDYSQFFLDDVVCESCHELVAR